MAFITTKPPEEVPESTASSTAPAAAKDIPVELQAPHTNFASSTSEQESQEIDIEGTGDNVDPLDDDIPMDLTTPLSSGSELNLSFESELVDEKGHQDKLATSSEVATIKKDDETMDVDVVGEGAATTSTTTPRTERVDSVQIDPSFQPESEVLLYEGDVENDGDESKSAPRDVQASVASAATTTTTHEEGFVLAVDDTFADLDVAPSGKSPPKKQESSSKPKSDKSSSKSQSTSSSQNVKTKAEGNSSSTATSSSKHPSKDSGKSTSSGSTENVTPSRFV